METALLQQQETRKGSLERTQEKPTFILKTEFQIWNESMQKYAREEEVSGAPRGTVGWERRQCLQKQGAAENGCAALGV